MSWSMASKRSRWDRVSRTCRSSAWPSSSSRRVGEVKRGEEPAVWHPAGELRVLLVAVHPFGLLRQPAARDVHLLRAPDEPDAEPVRVPASRRERAGTVARDARLRVDVQPVLGEQQQGLGQVGVGDELRGRGQEHRRRPWPRGRVHAGTSPSSRPSHASSVSLSFRSVSFVGESLGLGPREQVIQVLDVLERHGVLVRDPGPLDLAAAYCGRDDHPLRLRPEREHDLGELCPRKSRQNWTSARRS